MEKKKCNACNKEYKVDYLWPAENEVVDNSGAACPECGETIDVGDKFVVVIRKA